MQLATLSYHWLLYRLISYSIVQLATLYVSLATIVQIATLSYYWLLCRAIGYSIIPLATPYGPWLLYHIIAPPATLSSHWPLSMSPYHTIVYSIIPLTTLPPHWLLNMALYHWLLCGVIDYSTVSLVTPSCH